MKPVDNLQDPRVAVTEAIVGAVGRLIGAPVCETAIVTLPDELRGWEFRPGHRLEPGLAHGSKAVDGVIEERSLIFRERDDNRRRHAGVFALYDWCWGADDQWLYRHSDDGMLFSHDHGYYLPGQPGTWDEQSLADAVDKPHPLNWQRDGLDSAELRRLAGRLRNLGAGELVGALSVIPISWPVADRELEAVGWFLQRRAAAVAGRLEGYTMGGQ